MNLNQLDRELEEEFDAGKTPFAMDIKAIASTQKTANIRIISTDIEWYNEFQIIVAVAKLDGIEYGAVFDRNTKKGYTVKLVRLNGRITDILDLDRIHEDEEWATMSDYFNKENVFDYNKIHQWLWNTRVQPALADGIPAHLTKKR